MSAPRNSWPVIVGGCYRSGTSLVRRLLNVHPHIHCGPEVKFFRDFYGEYPEDSLDHLRFLTTARTLVPETELLRVLGGAFVELHEAAARLAGKVRWADKNPENSLRLAEWDFLLGTEWLFLCVVRNPLDTLASVKEAQFPLSIPARLGERITMYRQYTEAGLEYAARNPARSRILVYEQLVTHPARTLSDLMRWMAEEFDDSQLRFNRVPHGDGLEDPKIATTDGIHSTSLNRWPGVLSDEEARRVWRDTRDLWQRLDPDGKYCPATPNLEEPRP